MEISIKLEKEEWNDYLSYIEGEVYKRPEPWISSFWAKLTIWPMIGATSMVVFNKFSEFHWPTAVSMAVCFALLYAYFILNSNRAKKDFEPLEKRPVA